MHLVLSRAEPEDFDAIVPLFYNAFGTIDMILAFFGHPTPRNVARCKKELLDATKEDVTDIFLKVEDVDVEVDVDVLDDDSNKTGKTIRRKKIVCASNWKIYPTYVPKKAGNGEAKGSGTENGENGAAKDGNGSAAAAAAAEDHFAHVDTPQQKADAATIVSNFMGRRERVCTEPHVLCFLLFTDPAYQRNGAGRMVMQWGNDVADALMLPCWLEASKAGAPLYAKMGYEPKEAVDVKTPSFHIEYTHMRRPPKVVRMEGTELKRVEP